MYTALSCKYFYKTHCIMYNVHRKYDSIPYSTTILHGHSLAVTSVDWKLIGQQSIIATCADDRV